LFIANFKDGKTISEKECSWDDLPNKDEITCLQLVHSPMDLIFYFQEHIQKLIPLLSTELAEPTKQTLKKLNGLIEFQKGYSSKKEELLELLKLKSVIGKWEKDLKIKYEELKVKETFKEEEQELKNTRDAIHRIKYWIGNANKIKNYSNFWKEQKRNCVSLTGSDKYHYFFFYWKHGELNVLAGPNMTLRSDFIFMAPKQALGMETQFQEIGMIVNKEGNCVCAKMDRVTGWTKVYYTTIQSIGLNTRNVYTYIDLDKIG